jgi:TRAP-type C4-dicarboxylate transport system permease small subunit
MHSPDPAPRHPLRAALDGLYLFAGYLAGGFLILIFLLMMGLSLGREIGVNIPAGDDFASWCMAAMAFLGLAHTFKSGEMIRVGLLIDRFQGRARRAFEVFSLVLGLGFVGFFAWHAVRLTIDSYRFDDMAQGVVAMPLWIPQIGYAGGLVILFIAFVDEFVHVLRGGDPRYEKPPATTAEEVVERAIQSGV